MRKQKIPSKFRDGGKKYRAGVTKQIHNFVRRICEDGYEGGNRAPATERGTRHKKRINLSSDLKTFILILFLSHYLKWKIFHFVSFAFCLSDTFFTHRTKWLRIRTNENKNNRTISIADGDCKMTKNNRHGFIAI